MPLDVTTIESAKPKEKIYRLYDEKGLYLEVGKVGNKGWRLKYRFGGKEKRISLGVYPNVDLMEARKRQDEARRLLANGLDPSTHRKAVNAKKVSEEYSQVNLTKATMHKQYEGLLDMMRDKLQSRDYMVFLLKLDAYNRERKKLLLASVKDLLFKGGEDVEL